MLLINMNAEKTAFFQQYLRMNCKNGIDAL